MIAGIWGREGVGGGLSQMEKIGWIMMFVCEKRKIEKKKGRGRREDPNHSILLRDGGRKQE